MKIRSLDGRWTVETVRYTDTGSWLRVKEYGYIREPLVRTVSELTKFGIEIDDRTWEEVK